MSLTDADLDEVNKEFMKWLNAREEAAGSLRRTTMFRSSWGPKAREMTKEQLLNYLIEVDKSPKTRVEAKDLDSGRPKIDVRDFVKGKND